MNIEEELKKTRKDFKSDEEYIKHIQKFGLTPIELENIELKKQIERLNKENNDLRKLYQRTYKHLFEIGNDELARYFQAQIDECRTFYVEPIIDYYKETKRLNNIINELERWVEDGQPYDDYITLGNSDGIYYIQTDIISKKIKELKEVEK